jgi:hypothetical protein
MLELAGHVRGAVAQFFDNCEISAIFHSVSLLF